GDWMGNWSGDIEAAARGRSQQISAQGALPVFILYNIPQRDCGGYSAGGVDSPDGYREWIAAFGRRLEGQALVVVLQPDGLALMDCLSADDQMTRLQLLSEAVTALQSSQVAVYLDAGHSQWHPPEEMASRLSRAGVAAAQGFSLNVSN